MFKYILEWWHELGEQKQKLVLTIGLLVIFGVLLGGAVIGIISGNKPLQKFPPVSTITETENASEDTEATEDIPAETEDEMESEITEMEDPQNSVGGNMTDQEGTSVDISQVVDQTPSNETREVT
ncbi:MAG TPA: hypothetical protein O0W86_03330, partial [Methanocorpusculum sp.]|nr:hypothetical protein [Methanocorpusculum sp.]